LGEFNIAVASDLPEVVSDIRSLYRGAPTSHRDQKGALAVEVRATHRSVLGISRYGVFCDGRPLRTRIRAAQVLPHVEWGINYQMISKRRDLLQLHAATLSYRGVGVVFAAPSGCGKSTLAAALLARGWQYLCDEFALIDPNNLELQPFPKALCLKSGSFELANVLRLPLATRRCYVKGIKGQVGYINPFALGQQAIARRSPLEFVVFPRYQPHGDVRIWPVSQGKAAFNLARCALNRYEFRDNAVDLFSRIASKTKALALQTGEPEATCDVLEQMIEGGIKDG